MTVLNRKSILLTSSDTLDPQVEIGGKAKQLYALKEMGLLVPKWVVIPYSHLQNNLDQNLILNLSQEITQHFESNTLLAVRSSANLEDGTSHSFAGLFDTILFVRPQEVQKYIQQVFSSATSDQVKAYCTHHDIEIGKIKMSVIVQEMVNADAAGVAFGAHPVSGDVNQKVINATWGVGEGLVSGALTADQFVIDGSETQQQIAKKDFAFGFDETTAQLAQLEVVKSKRNIPCLQPPHIAELVQVLEQTADHFGAAQDIEFAIFKNKIYYLQSRPVTKLKNNTKPLGNRQVWDNSNIVESYPGISAPLTFSFIRRVYEAVYIEFSLLMGVSPTKIEAHADIYKNMLGLIRGRVYYNLAGWYKALALLPGYSINAPFMEKMMGVKESFDLPKEALPAKKDYLGLIKAVFKILYSFFTLKKSRIRFMALLDNTIEKMDAQDYSTYDSNQLLGAYEKLEYTLLKKWQAPLVNDFFAMIFYGLLEKLSGKWLGHLRANFHNELLAGSSDIISVEPIRLLDNIYQALEADPIAKRLFLEEEPTQVWKVLLSKKHIVVMETIQQYISKFGDRAMGELKLETITYRQAPETFVTYIQNGLRNGYKSHSNTKANTIREDAEKALRANLKGVKRWVYTFVLNQARDLISGRENLRFERTRAFGQVRKIFSALGLLWASNNIITEGADIYYLTREEINDFIKGMSVSPDLKTLIAQRKDDYMNYTKGPVPNDRIETFGAVYYNNDFDIAQEANETDGTTWQGTGASAGKVKATIRIVKDPKEIGTLNGSILVATCTDPSWVTLFPSAAGILVERGSMLSHSAIVAREMGIPCIVGVDNLIAKITDGALVEMDGSTGQIRLIA